jgi:hypothetical protein
VTGSMPCGDCGIDTALYMVRDDVWARALTVGPPRIRRREDGAQLPLFEGAVAVRFLCIGCLERRLDRMLAPEDFTDAPINQVHRSDSERLRARKRAVAEVT